MAAQMSLKENWRSHKAWTTLVLCEEHAAEAKPHAIRESVNWAGSKMDGVCHECDVEPLEKLADDLGKNLGSWLNGGKFNFPG